MGALLPSPAQGCLQVRDALPGPLLVTSSKVAITVGLKKASWVFHRLFTACGEDRTRVKIGLVPTTGRPDGSSERGLSASPVTGRTALGSPRGRAGLGGWGSPPRDRPVSPMEGTSGAADPAPLRGGVGDAALGLDTSCRRAHAQAWYVLGWARSRARSFRRVASGSAGSCPSRGWGLRGGIVKASLSRGTQARGHTRALARGGSEGILRWRLAVSESPAGIAAVSRREVSERIGLG